MADGGIESEGISKIATRRVVQPAEYYDPSWQLRSQSGKANAAFKKTISKKVVAKASKAVKSTDRENSNPKIVNAAGNHKDHQDVVSSTLTSMYIF